MALNDDELGLKALRAADERWSKALPSAEADLRIRAALSAKRPAPLAYKLVPAMAFSLGLGVAISAALWRAPTPSMSPTSPATPVAVLGFEPSVEPCSAAEERGALLARGACSYALAAPGLHLRTDGLAKLEPLPDGVRLLRGRARFHVDKVKAGAPPVRVVVQRGAIEVLGTEFVVVEEEEGGHVDLLEGRIRFRDASGAITEVQPGRRLRWSNASGPFLEGSESGEPPIAGPDASRTAPAAPVLPTGPGPTRVRGKVPAPTPEPSVTPSPVDRAASKAAFEAALAEIAALRTQGRYSEAVRALEVLETSAAGQREREVLGFEIGRLLEVQIGDRRRACAHWTAYLREFPAGRYQAQVARSLRTVCD